MTENSTSTALAVTKPTELKTKKLILLRHGESLSNQQKNLPVGVMLHSAQKAKGKPSKRPKC